MRRAVTGLGLAMLLATSGMALADPVADCTQSRSLERKIKSCTDIIKDKAYGPREAALAFRHRASARAQAGAYEDALSDYTQSIKINATDAGALAGRGQARLARGDIDGALGDYNEALKLSPTSVTYFIGRGHVRLVKGLNDLAVADFSEAVRLDPKSASAHNNRGLAHRKMGNLDAALADYTQAITLNPIYALAYNNRAYVYEAQGRKQEAMIDYGRALVLDPSLIEASKAQRRLGGAAGYVDETDRLVKQGQAIVEASCSRCHAIGRTGASPNAKAPEFRTLQQRHPVQAMREPLSRGIAATHEEMPKFALKDLEVDAIVAYINSLPTMIRR